MDTKPTFRILVVEDDLITAKSIALSLGSAGYKVVDTVPSGEEAIIRAIELLPDLVLMDIRLSGLMDGILAAHQIQAHLDIPVVYLTAYSDDETLKRVIYSRPYGYVSKPYQQQELLETIQAALTRHEEHRTVGRHR
jgi:CheY-like chemotaxis protein